MIASDSHSQIVGMDFFHSLPVPELWEWIFFIPFPFPNFGNGFFSFPSRSRILGMGFFHSLPIPEIWEWIFLFPSRSRISGMGFFNSLPVPEFREWFFSIPFPFPNPQKSFPLTPESQCNSLKESSDTGNLFKVLNIIGNDMIFTWWLLCSFWAARFRRTRLIEDT